MDDSHVRGRSADLKQRFYFARIPVNSRVPVTPDLFRCYSTPDPSLGSIFYFHNSVHTFSRMNWRWNSKLGPESFALLFVRTNNACKTRRECITSSGLDIYEGPGKMIFLPKVISPSIKVSRSFYVVTLAMEAAFMLLRSWRVCFCNLLGCYDTAFSLGKLQGDGWAKRYRGRFREEKAAIMTRIHLRVKSYYFVC